MPLAESLYAAALRAARPLLPLAARGGGKLARGVRGRAGVLERMEAWAAARRDPARPLVWFHAPSVGEGLQARAVVEALRAARPDAQVAYTFFSPSAEGFARTVPADFADHLPLDLPEDARRALEALRPAVLAFGKTEVWPVLTREAAARGVRLTLLSATLPAGSSRLRAPARALLGPAYRRLDAVGAIAEEDAARFARLGVDPGRVEVAGDARFDQVLARAAAAAASPLLPPFRGWEGPTLVAGSTWPEDEARLLPAVAEARRAGIPLRLVLVPHEPTAGHLAEAERAVARAGLPPPHRLSAVEAGGTPGGEVLVDRVGVLGELYALADVAYVGGGWGRSGLHSVLEPAAFGAPVLFGPRHANAREAAELVRAGGAVAAADARTLSSALLRWAAEAEARARSGAAARAYVARHAGAAARNAAILLRLLPSAPGARPETSCGAPRSAL